VRLKQQKQQHNANFLTNLASYYVLLSHYLEAIKMLSIYKIKPNHWGSFGQGFDLL